MANKHLLPKLSLFLPFLMILLVCCFHAHGLRILFSGAVDSGTHIGSMMPLIRRLASRGHQVTVLELATLDKPRQLGPNVSVLFRPVPVEQGIATAQAAAMFRQALNGRTLHLPYQFGNQRFEEFMEREAQLFVRLLNGLPRFDLVIVDELFGVHSFALALHLHHFQAVPYVIYSTTMMVQSSAFALALGRNFVAEPNLLTSPPVDSQDKYRAASWANRLDNLWTVGWDILRVQYQTQNFLNGPESALRMLGIDRFSFRQFFSDASFLFVDYLDRVPAPLAEGPDLVPISAHCAPAAHSLPPDLALFVDDPNSAGTIFVAFGTNVQWRFAPASTVWALFLALNRLAQHRVLVSFNAPVPANLSLGAHVRVLAWAPQADILAHPRTRLFISHAGLKSFKETLCAKMPAVLMPVYAEQSYNTKVGIRLGFATAVNKLTVSEASLSQAIDRILSDYGHFKANAARAHAFFVDRPLDGLTMAEFGVRRAVLEAKGGSSRRRKWRHRRGMDMDTLRHANGDWLLALLAVVVLLAWR